MKKYLLIIILITIILFITSCSAGNIEIGDTIMAPKNESLPIYGKWVIEDYKVTVEEEEVEEIVKYYMGKDALFHEDLVVLGDDCCKDPIFKTKNVNTWDYILYHYKTNPDFLGIEKDKIQIISITSEDQFFYEFIKESDDKIIVNIDGVFFYLRLVSQKISDEDVAEYFYKEKAMFKSSSLADSQIVNSSILIGLKSLNLEDQNGNIENWNYRTILIRSYNKEIVSIYEMKDIFLPRKTGFWKVEVQREKDNDKILAYPLKKTVDGEMKKRKIVKGKEKTGENNSLKNILYVGNDYISIEKINHLNKGERLLEFYLIDNLNEDSPVKISHIAGEAGKASLLDEGYKAILSSDSQYRYSSIDFSPNEENFGLFRRNGHWIYKGRVNFVQDGMYSYKNFNIKVVPSKEVVHYDELHIPWNAIKSKVPEAIDAFTSPAEDIIIIVTRNSIMIYPIDKGDIGHTPIGKIKLKPTEKIIMDEWSIGKYPEIWEEEFIKNGGVPIED